MANREHIRKLKEGVAAWNKWREQKPQLIPDFSDADLAGIKLKQVPVVANKVTPCAFAIWRPKIYREEFRYTIGLSDL
jgi:hypothetical protein